MKLIKTMMILTILMVLNNNLSAKPIVIDVAIGERPCWWTGGNCGCVPGYYFCWGLGEKVSDDNQNTADINIDEMEITIKMTINSGNRDFIMSLINNGKLNFTKEEIPIDLDLTFASCGQKKKLFIPKGIYDFEISENMITFTAQIQELRK
jgi:hypothetical protein